MPLTPTSYKPSETQRKVWTRNEAQWLLDSGFPNAERLELIEGDLIIRVGKNHPHVFWQTLIREWLESIFGSGRVRVESPINVSETSEPEPDLIVTEKTVWDYEKTPAPTDVLLVVEIADTTVDFDLGVKARLYAQAGIKDYWVVNVQQKRVVIHREPEEGIYTSFTAFESHELFSPLAYPDAICCLDRIGSRGK